MKKKVVASLAAAMILGVAGTSFAAANPFSDVPAKHWAYASVTQLAQAGIVDGYGDGTYKGDKLITRYEMAQIVAKALARSDKATPAQKAALDKLAAEFEAELNQLGARVTKLEKNQPNLKFSGTLVLRDTAKDYPNDSTKTDNSGAVYRLRLDAKADVDANTSFGLRFVTVSPLQNKLSATGLPTNTTWNKNGGTTATTIGSADSSLTPTIDRAWVNTKLFGIDASAGRQALVVGTTNGIVDSGAFSYDGLKLSKKFGAVQAVANYGRIDNVSATSTTTITVGSTLVNGVTVPTPISTTVTTPAYKLDATSFELSTKTSKAGFGVGYFQIKNDASGIPSYVADTDTLGRDLLKLTYINGFYNFSPKFAFIAEGGQNKANNVSSNNKYYNLFLKAGDQVLDAKDKQNVIVEYYSVGANALALSRGAGTGLTTLDTTKTTTNFTGWDFSYNRAFSKNLSTEFHYVRIDDKATSVNDYNYYRVNVVSKF